MKIAVTATAPEMSAPMDERFGRAQYFMVVDTETGESESIDNSVNVDAAQGAGNKTAESLLRHGVKVVVTGHCGPNAFRVLSAAGIQVNSATGLTVEQAVEQFKFDALKVIPGADVNGHWK